MTGFKIWQDIEKQQLRFSGSISDHDFQKLKLDGIDKLLWEDDKDNAADWLLNLQMLFRCMVEQAILKAAGGECG